MASNIPVSKVSDAQPRTDPVFLAVDTLADSIRARAFELFAQRGFCDGFALEDWLRAEREFAWPAAELCEADRAYRLTMSLPGYTAEQVKVTVTPHEIIVSAAAERKTEDKSSKTETVRWSEFRSAEVCRRIELPLAIDVNQVTASLQDGVLTVKAAQVARAEKRAVPIGVAA
jgi:HSP20 family molecular chaperone IbpA